MKRLLFSFMGFMGVVACGGSQSEESTGQQKARLSCDAITPDTDVCLFAFDPSQLRSVESVLVTAKTARDARTDVEAACLGGLADLGRNDVSPAESCEALALAIRTTIPRLTIDIGEPTCRQLAPAACLGSAAPSRERCAASEPTAVAPDDATDFERLVARVVRDRFGPIERAKRDMSGFSDLVGDVSGRISDAPAECAPAMVRMVQTATDDAKQALFQTNAALAVISDRP